MSHVFSLKLPWSPLHIWNSPCSSMIFLSKMLDFAKFPEDSIACCQGSDWPSGNLFSATRNPSNFQNSMIACRKVMHSRHKLYIECVQHVFFQDIADDVSNFLTFWVTQNRFGAARTVLILDPWVVPDDWESPFRRKWHPKGPYMKQSVYWWKHMET